MDQLQWAATGFMEHWGWFVALFATMSAGFLYLYRRQQRHLVLLMASSPAALLLFQAQKGELMFANLAAYSLFGIRRVGKNFFFPPHLSSEQLQLLLNTIANCAEKRIAAVIEWPMPGSASHHIELSARATHYRGRKVWLVNAVVYHHSAFEQQHELNSLSIAKTALDSLSELIYVKDLSGQRIATNRAFDQFWLGREEEGSEVFSGIMKGRASQQRWTTTPDGRSCLLETYQSVLMSPRGDHLGVLGISHDVTDWHNIQRNLRDEMEKRKDTEVALAQRDTILQSILDASPDSIGIFNENMVYQACNRPFIDALGLSDVSELIGKRLQDVVPESVYARLSESDSQVLKSGQSLRYLDKVDYSNGRQVWYDVVKSPFRDPISGTRGVLIMARDVSERYLSEQKLEAANQELERLSYLDSLTQVANRRRFDAQLQTLWHLHAREKRPLSVMLCDVDYFKGYNDSYGHLQGDDILRMVAQAFNDVINRSSDCVARYGGEEFAIILPNTALAGAQLVAQRIHGRIAELALPHQSSAVSPYVTVSIGVVTCTPQADDSPEIMLAWADSALCQAKANGRNQTCVHPVSL